MAFGLKRYDQNFYIGLLYNSINMGKYAPTTTYHDGDDRWLLFPSGMAEDPFLTPILMDHTKKSAIEEETLGRAERRGRNKGEWRNAHFESPHKLKAIAELKNSLDRKRPVKAYQLKDGRVLELRIGSENDAENILTRDHEDYNVIRLPTPDFRIASFSDSPSDPIGFYFITSYFEKGECRLKKERAEQKWVCEPGLVYVSLKHRGQHLGSILTMSSTLDSLDDGYSNTLKFAVENERIGNILQNLGFEPAGKTIYGYDEYKIDLQGRKSAVREVFQRSLNQYLQSATGR